MLTHSQQPPNVILILCDQLRADCIGAYGNTQIDTPNLDHLASRGTTFQHAYSAVPSCIPSRATLLSGQSQWHTGVLGMGRGQGEIPNDFAHTLAGEFTKANYRTHLVGKGHFYPQRSPMGFQSMELEEAGRTLIHNFKDEYREWFDQHAPKGVTPDDHGVDWNSWMARPWHTAEHLHPSAWTTTRSIDFLHSRDKEQPFFLNISFDRPHSPYCPPQPYWDRYINASLPGAVVGDWADMHDQPQDAMDVNAWRGRKTEQQIHRARAGYYGDVSFIDTQIGVLLNWMRRFDAEALENTWILFTSDHGDMLGDHNLWRKTYAYEGSARVPLIIAPPSNNTPHNSHADQTVELRDVMPTLLAAAGIKIPNTVDGESMLPLTQDSNAPWREYIHVEHCLCYHEDQEMQFVTNGKRKYIWLPRIDIEQFFDLEADPNELTNLIDDPAHSDEIQSWRTRLIDELQARDCGWVVDGNLHCPKDQTMISPYKDTRWQGL